jgi:hypothetical protein
MKMFVIPFHKLRFCITNKNIFFVTLIGTKRSLIALCRQQCHQSERAVQNTASKNCAGTARRARRLAFWQLYNERASAFRRRDSSSFDIPTFVDNRDERRADE